MTKLTLGGLSVYPIKSAAGVSLRSATMTARGLQYDRRWMVVDAKGHFLTQRRFPRMALIRVSIADVLCVSAPDMPELKVPLASETGERVKVEVWGDVCEAIAVGPEAQKWFTRFVGITCQLVYMPERSHRFTAHGDLGDTNLVSFADAYPYLLLSEASLTGLNEKLAEPVSMDRFRPNLIVSGCAEPHAEDKWKTLRIGKAIFTVSKPCARCSIPAVNQATGKRGKEPTQTLATYRSWDRAIWFGQNLVAQNVAQNVAQSASSDVLQDTSDHLETLRVGDEVEILA